MLWPRGRCLSHLCESWELGLLCGCVGCTHCMCVDIHTLFIVMLSSCSAESNFFSSPVLPQILKPWRLNTRHQTSKGSRKQHWNKTPVLALPRPKHCSWTAPRFRGRPGEGRERACGKGKRRMIKEANPRDVQKQCHGTLQAASLPRTRTHTKPKNKMHQYVI